MFPTNLTSNSFKYLVAMILFQPLCLKYTKISRQGLKIVTSNHLSLANRKVQIG